MKKIILAAALSTLTLPAYADLSQANTDLNSSLNNFKFYPVIAIGVGYTF